MLSAFTIELTQLLVLLLRRIVIINAARLTLHSIAQDSSLMASLKFFLFLNWKIFVCNTPTQTQGLADLIQCQVFQALCTIHSVITYQLLLQYQNSEGQHENGDICAPVIPFREYTAGQIKHKRNSLLNFKYPYHLQ